jgi:pyridoxal phosphate enzyme (YggS family)
MASTISDRIAQVRQRIEVAAIASDREPTAITLVAVGKTFPPEMLAAAVAAGITDLGEIRVQETAAKKPLVPTASWHLIGPLQRNKARRALELFDVIHTVDRPDLVQRLGYLLEEHWPGRRQPILIELNVGREPQKSGVLPEDAANLVTAALATPHLEVMGLMAIPPQSSDPEEARGHFRIVRELRDRLQDRCGTALPELSMGMTQDFEIAIAEGATMVRIGTAIFGSRS